MCTDMHRQAKYSCLFKLISKSIRKANVYETMFSMVSPLNVSYSRLLAWSVWGGGAGLGKQKEPQAYKPLPL